jgi:hypothetical protein
VLLWLEPYIFFSSPKQCAETCFFLLPAYKITTMESSLEDVEAETRAMLISKAEEQERARIATREDKEAKEAKEREEAEAEINQQKGKRR